MATENDEKPQEEPKIPVFTVIKNGAILKNIFIINNNNCPTSELSDQTITIGRHPDCNVMLTHPSISRFHLKIISNPSSQTLSVIDLSSVHGTWVSEKKIEPWDRVEINEGDSLRIGGSSRVYRLHWIPLSEAYSFETPCVPASDEPMEEEKDDDFSAEAYQDVNSMLEENMTVSMEMREQEKERYEDPNSLFLESREIQSLGIVDEDLSRLLSEESLGMPEKKEIPSAPPIPGNFSFSLFDENEEGIKSPLKDLREDKEILNHNNKGFIGADSEKLTLAMEGINLNYEFLGFVTDTEAVCERVSPKISLREQERTRPLESTLVAEFLCERESPEISLGEIENVNPFSIGTDLSDNSSLLVEQEDSSGYDNSLAVQNLNSFSGCSVEVHRSSETLEESVNLSLPTEEVLETVEDKENQTLQSFSVGKGIAQSGSSASSSLGSIWFRRGKPANAIDLQMSNKGVQTGLGIVDSIYERHDDQENTEEKSVSNEVCSILNGEEDEIVTPNKENFSPNTFLAKAVKSKGKAVDSGDKKGDQGCKPSLCGEEEEVFTPDKENLTPNSFPMKSSRKKGVLEVVKYSKPSRLSPLKVTRSLTTCPEENSPQNENRTEGVLQELKPVKRSSSVNKSRLERGLLVSKKRQERVLFQLLLEKSDGNIRSQTQGTTSATRTMEMKITIPVSNNSARQSRSAWIMVADTTTLLNKRSRDSLELLQGLNHTRLVIPQLVISELRGMNQRGSLFKRKTEACLVLEWIEQCMVEASSWIRVQSSGEDGRLTAPTPPAFRQTNPFIDEATSEIVSPTTQDHIIECALMSRKMNGDKQVVVLSNDATLKVKAMAEGMLCEAVKEFRGSLINPFSERFLWAESAPRGQTWSIADDVVLREKYDRCPLKRPVNAKGLKLILLHNSHYAQRTPIR